ncbi:hypothetical protein [Microbacterium sp.]|uniref:hypothetical protein n=1 Tax=Microbacterium sp. TaxID=51671 RepID=UPI002811F958|nr:hypothetical protein [Microbacterium sp.]
MSPGDSAFWAGQLLTTVAAAAGVLLAFALERTTERRHQDAAAFWAAKHWARAVLRTRENGLLITAIRGMVYGRSVQKRPEVQKLLTEVDPGVAEWWSRATECLVEADDSWVPGSDVSKCVRAWVEAVEAELDRAGGRWPRRRRRLERLQNSLPNPPKLTRRAVRRA